MNKLNWPEHDDSSRYFNIQFKVFNFLSILMYLNGTTCYVNYIRIEHTNAVYLLIDLTYKVNQQGDIFIHYCLTTSIFADAGESLKN